MGLEGVELVMAYEDAFGLEIADTDAVNLLTPRDVIEFLAARVPMASESACLEQRAFYLLRSTAMEMTATERRSITRATPVSSVFMFMSPSEISKRLSEKLKTRSRISIDRMTTVEDVVRELVRSSIQVVKRDSPWTKGEIAHVVKQITLEQLGDVSYAEDRRFVEDMGMGTS